jgi:2-methylcitrate dehydratase PrpD
MAASGGVRSALLAQAGFTAPDGILEGDKGFCAAFGDRSKLELLTAGLGSEWQILKSHYKIYAQDGYIQPMSEALDRIMQQHSFEPEDIAEIRAGTNKHAIGIVGLIREPKDLTSAQFSANFSLALFAYRKGAGFHEYSEHNLFDPGIIALSQRIRTEVDDEIEAEWQKTKPRGARVTVRLNSGAVYTECVPMLRAMTAQDVNDKFRRLASVVLEAATCEQLIDLVRNLDGVRDVSSLAPMLVRTGPV